jgi:hypothetical protein
MVVNSPISPWELGKEFEDAYFPSKDFGWRWMESNRLTSLNWENGAKWVGPGCLLGTAWKLLTHVGSGGSSKALIGLCPVLSASFNFFLVWYFQISLANIWTCTPMSLLCGGLFYDILNLRNQVYKETFIHNKNPFLEVFSFLPLPRGILPCLTSHIYSYFLPGRWSSFSMDAINRFDSSLLPPPSWSPPCPLQSNEIFFPSHLPWHLLLDHLFGTCHIRLLFSCVLASV